MRRAEARREKRRKRGVKQLLGKPVETKPAEPKVDGCNGFHWKGRELQMKVRPFLRSGPGNLDGVLAGTQTTLRLSSARHSRCRN